jgi:ribosome biogenesis GTPase / thiamine phosphate phosphatase
MPGKRKPRDRDMTDRYLSDDVGDDFAHETRQTFSARSGDKAQQRKIERTALLRAAEEAAAGDVESLPVAQVTQVYSLYCDVEREGVTYLCVVRKTLQKLLETAIVVGDFVKLRETGISDEQGRPEAVIEQLLPRQTLLTRSDSFKAIEQHPIVANAGQMLIVVSLREPEPRWGLVDRMIVAAQAGGLVPVVCLNKMDLANPVGEPSLAFLNHYASLNILTLRTSVRHNLELDELRNVLAHRTTVLAGHSGVGKSSLINAVQPQLDLRTGAISGYTGKGRHTTTSAKRFPLEGSPGYVIDTPGVKLFGLWNVTRENLLSFFPDVATETAPPWRVESYGRILESLPD